MGEHSLNNSAKAQFSSIEVNLTEQKRGPGMLGIKRRNGGELMPKPLEAEGERMYSAGYALIQSQEPLPPYELDPQFNSPAVRKRIGEVIAEAMEYRFSKG